MVNGGREEHRIFRETFKIRPRILIDEDGKVGEAYHVYQPNCELKDSYRYYMASSVYLVDCDGNATDDPAVLASDPKGALLPLGGLDAGYKGFGLALVVEALTAGLAGFGRADTPEGWGGTVFVQVLDPEAFCGLDAFRRQVHLAEELGCDLVTIGDAPFAWNELYVTMTVAALETRTATVSPMVSVPALRHPVADAAAMPRRPVAAFIFRTMPAQRGDWSTMSSVCGVAAGTSSRSAWIRRIPMKLT